MAHGHLPVFTRRSDPSWFQFDAHAYMPVAAGRCAAIVQAFVSLQVVGVVTGFNTSLHMSVTTGGANAIVEAGVGLHLIAVVAGLKAGLAFS